MAVNSRSKGKMGEREIALLMRECGYTNARRSAQYCGNTGDAPDVVGVDVFLQQAEREAKKGLVPIVMYRRNKEKWKVCIRLDLFMLIWKELTDLQRHNIAEKIKFMCSVDKIRK